MVSPLDFPNLFILGAPKCGTTFLSQYLSLHPDVEICPTKEPGTLANDLAFRAPVPFEEDYLQLFNFQTRKKFYGEGTVVYLYSKAARQRIKERSPQAKLIIMTRRVVPFIEALFTHNKIRGQEDAETVEEALAFQEVRKKGGYIPRECHSLCFLQYEMLSDYVRFIDEVLSDFPRENVFIETQECFKRDQSVFLSRLYSFLDIPYLPELRLADANIGRVSKSSLIQNILSKKESGLRNFSRAVLPEKFREFIFWKLWHWNLKKGAYRIEQSDVRAKLEETNTHQMEHLSGIIGRDLAGEWSNTSKL